MAADLSTATIGIGAAAARHGVSVDTLRYYEKVGLLEPADRDAGGRRRYTEQSLAVVPVIRALREVGFGIAQIRDVVASKQGCAPAENVARLRSRLQALRDELAAKRVGLDRADELLTGWLAELDSTGY